VPIEPDSRLPHPPRTLADIGEDGLIAGLVHRFGTAGAVPGGPVLVGPGDDAAVLQVPAGRLVACTDTLVEGLDFRREWSTGRHVGIKAAAQNLADVAAMGATPLALLVSLSAPGDVPVDWTDGLSEGLAQECARGGCSVVGGDLSSATEIVVVGTALGLLAGPPVLRSGARPGDLVAVAGRLGASAAGWALLASGAVPGPDADLGELVELHRAPRPPYRSGPAARVAGASAMIDTSDGLLRDAARIGASSGVTLDLDPDALAPDPALLAAARRLGASARDWVLTGGEDHALLACFPPGAAVPGKFRVIGAVREPSGPGVTVAGRAWTGADGWRHFGPQTR
jgi:thiamine-monophosphate kinase